MIEIQTLQYFLAVARMQTITAAAEELYITQPHLSRRMAELEQTIGKVLFIRGKRRITLTDEGLLLKQRAEDIIALLIRTETELSAKEELLKGDLSIGLPELSSTRLITRAIHKMRLQQPYVKFHLVSGKAEEIMQKVNSGELDTGIVQEEVDLQSYDYLRLPCKDTWGVLMRNDAPLAKLEQIGPEDLRSEPLMVFGQQNFKNKLAGWIGVNDRRLNIIADYNLPIHVQYMVEDDGCYALIPEGVVSIDRDSPLCYRPLKPTLGSDMTMIWKKYRPFTKNMDYFYRVLRKEEEVLETT